MARAHFVKKARKDYPESNIKRGESYYWWKFRYGGIHKSKTRPTRSQLTQSGFLSALYDLEDSIAAELAHAELSDFEGAISNFVSEIESLRDECQDSLDNMPEHLQESSESGMLLQERINALESWISDLEYIDTEIDEDTLREEATDDEEFNELLQNRIEEIKDEIENANPGIS